MGDTLWREIWQYPHIDNIFCSQNAISRNVSHKPTDTYAQRQMGKIFSAAEFGRAKD